MRKFCGLLMKTLFLPLCLILAVACSAPTPVSGQFASDTFTDTDATLLQDHVPDIGGAWTKARGTTDMVINSNHVFSTASAALTYYVPNTSSTTNDVDVQADFYWDGTGTDTTPCIVGRASEVQTTAYAVRHDVVAVVWQLRRYLNSTTGVQIGFYGGDSPTTVRTVKLQMRGDQLSVYIDGVLRIGPITDANIVSGKAGVGVAGAGPDHYWLDNFKATTTKYPTKSGGMMLP